ncbi:MAG TPA: transposase family protein [Thermoanaerobacterales bacterium]|nr:transposase family protein [Thermoanaerobacterales bacterium]
MTIEEPNKLCEIDIKYGYIPGESRFFYIMPIIDVFDRFIVDFHIGLSCTAQDAARTLQRAMFKRQLFDAKQKPIIRSDNGPQFISHNFQQSCLINKVEHERIPCRTF